MLERREGLVGGLARLLVHVRVGDVDACACGGREDASEGEERSEARRGWTHALTFETARDRGLDTVGRILENEGGARGGRVREERGCLEEDLRVRLAIRDVVPRDHVREDAIEEVRVA